MATDSSNKQKTNTLTIDGITFKTSGNISFANIENQPFILAQSTMLDQMDNVLDNGIQMLMKKIKTSVSGAK